MTNIRLPNGLELPSLGLGLWQVTDREQMRMLVSSAYETGYRLFDTASAYSNEMALGRALKEMYPPPAGRSIFATRPGTAAAVMSRYRRLASGL